MKEHSFNEWCKTAWLKFSLMISGIMILLILINWNVWALPLKCIAAITAWIPVHATEEWLFPGGFAFQYNLFLNNSKYPTRFPMNRASDMFTVLGTTLMFGIITLCFAITGHTVPSGILLGAACFSALEVSVHTYFGIRAYLKFKSKGKTTIYGTGSMTSYTGFLALCVIMLREVITTGITSTDIIFCILILAIISILCLVPEIKFKDTNTPYAYSSSGYYERFLSK